MASGTEAQLQLTVRDKYIQQHGHYWYEEMLLPASINAKLLPRIKSFDFADEDILISTYPRSGTTWTQEMTWLICNNSDTDGARATDLEDRCPFMEFTEAHIKKPNIDILEKRTPPRIIKTHFQPQFFENRNYKTILVMRNVKDVIVSYYHFSTQIYGLEVNWEEFYEMFKQDQLFYGSWLKHVLQCWKLRDDPNVLLLKYEDMQRDRTGTIKRIAKLCGKTLTEEQIKAIADYTKIGNTKSVFKSSRKVRNNSKYSHFIRNGAVGEWKEWFSNEQLEYVEGVLKEAEKEGLVFDDKVN